MKLAAVSNYEVQSLVARAGLGTEGMVTPANLRPVCTRLGDVRRADIVSAGIACVLWRCTVHHVAHTHNHPCVPVQAAVAWVAGCSCAEGT